MCSAAAAGPTTATLQPSSRSSRTRHSSPPPMTDALPEPQQRLPEAAVGLWRLVLGLWCAGLLVVSLALMPVADDIGLPVWLAPLLVVLLGTAAVVAIPRVRWRRWRYEV